MTETYQCMEVWGGNQPADNGVVMPGVDAWVVSRPFEDDDAGGDVHYVSSCATGRITRFLVADVSGHGSTVSAVASSLRTLMRRYVNFVDQGRLVAELNREFGALSQNGAFATAVVATYFTPTGYLTLCNAGHPRPLHYSNSKRAWRVLHPGEVADDPSGDAPANIPLGIADGVSYDQLGLRLARGDIVLFYTDAILEVFDARGTQLGEQGLLDLVRSLPIGDTQAFLSGVLRAIEAFGGRPKDDITLLAVRPNAMHPRTTIAERVGASARFLRLCFSRSKDSPIPWPELTLVNIGGAILNPINRLWGGRPRTHAK